MVLHGLDTEIFLHEKVSTGDKNTDFKCYVVVYSWLTFVQTIE